MRKIGIILLVLGVVIFLLSILVGGFFLPIGPEGLNTRDALIQNILGMSEVASIVLFIGGIIVFALSFLSKNKNK